MRTKHLIIGDIKFQFKYGFYFVYTVFSIFYICLIYFLPPQWKKIAATIMIFSDPAAMGLFFMGAIVLLEKSQMVLNTIAVSPVKVSEYIISKVVSLGIISIAVGFLLALSANIANLLPVIVGVFLGSTIFTLLGLIFAARIHSLNQFIVATIPLEIISFLPPIFYIFGFDKTFMLIHPGCILIRLISGNKDWMLLLIIILFLWIGLLYLITYRIIKKMFQEVGGVKL